jgi:acyl carrier protein
MLAARDLASTKERSMPNLACEAPTQGQLSSTERTLGALWTEILRSTDLPKPTDNFFELGGSSIDMVMLLFRIQEEFFIDLGDSAVFEAPSLRELAALIDAARIPQSNSE